MNWTGGRLRRQSHNRPDSISKIQKQHFARARIKQQESRQKARIASIENPSFVFSGRKPGGSPQYTVNSVSIQSIAHIDQLSQNFEPKQGQADFPNGGNITSGNTSSETSKLAYVDSLKRYLLSKEDWVGLSPTRPLQMKFASVEEKERVGKRRKLSREDELRSIAMSKNLTRSARISSHADRPQLGGGLYNRMDWDLKVHVSSPKRVRTAQEDSESPIRSMSSDTMLSEFGDRGDAYIFPEHNEQRSRAQSSMEDKPDADNYTQNPDIQTYPVQDLDSLERGGSADPIENNNVHLQSSPLPVLHRFTLDDQVLAERLANSEMEAKSLDCPRSGHCPAMLTREMLHDYDIFDDETLLGSSPRIQSVDGLTNASDSRKSYPTDSDMLPQTQKISRHLPPSQYQMARSPIFEAQSHTPNFTSRFTIAPESEINTKEPSTLFGQRVHSPIPKPSSLNADFVAAEHPFQSSMHGFRMTSRCVLPVGTSRAVDQIPALGSMTHNRSVSGFRFPDLWTPHRPIPQLSSYETRQGVPTSPVLISHRGPSAFRSTLSQGNSTLVLSKKESRQDV